MDRHKGRLEFALAISITVLLLLVALPQSAYAQGIIYGDVIPSGTVVENDVVLAGEDVTISGKVDGDVIAVGKTIYIDGEVTGSLVAIGNNIRVDGTVAGSTYSYGLTFDMGGESAIGRALYFLGLSLTMEEGSVIERDLVTLSMGAQLGGDVRRDLRAIIGPLEIFQLAPGLFGGELDLLRGTSSLEDTLVLHSSEVSGRVFEGSYLGTMGSPIAIMWRTNPAALEQSNLATLPQSSSQWQTGVDWPEVGDWSISRGREFIPLLLIGLLMLWLFPQLTEKGSQELVSHPLQVIGYGLLALVLALNLIVILGLLAFLIFVIGLWFGVISVWEFALVFWGVGLALIILVGSLIVLYALFATKVLIAYLIGTSILRPLWADTDRYRIVPLLLGLLIYVLIAGIPILGFALRIIVTGLGLGATWVYLLELRKEPEAPKKSSRAKS